MRAWRDGLCLTRNRHGQQSNNGGGDENSHGETTWFDDDTTGTLASYHPTSHSWRSLKRWHVRGNRYDAGFPCCRRREHIRQMATRREFVERTALSAIGLLVPDALAGILPGKDAETQARAGFLNLLRAPDRVVVQTTTGTHALNHYTSDRWTSDGGIVVTTAEQPGALRVAPSTPSVAIKRLYLRWRGDVSSTRLIMGDAWERAYGDLEWRTWIPDRVMPWYFATHDGSVTNAYGVRTGPGAFCYWQIDKHGISLCADVRSGTAAVLLGERTLGVCDVVCRAGHTGESAFGAVHAFCRQMCQSPRLPSQPVYGSNDWYWAYGKNSADSVRVDAQHIVELSPTGKNRPFVVIDDGWQPGRGKDETGLGTWDRGNEKFPDMPGLTADVRKIGARAGVWIRPLQPAADTPDNQRLARERTVLDPTVPEVRQKIAEDITRLREWGFELIKHDYTTFDIFGRWGFQMGTDLTRGEWTFASGAGRTTAEVITDLYAAIRAAAGESLVIGCNTVSHLSAGQFELCRVGDDTSGTDWGRTRKMGVNSLAFRGAQHDAFYAVDADCVGVTNDVPWTFNRQWLDLLARSGTTLFVSLAPDALGARQRADLRSALALAATRETAGEPLDWQRTVYPETWKLRGEASSFDWVGEDGVGLP
jgi:alpha-galactosidase